MSACELRGKMYMYMYMYKCIYKPEDYMGDEKFPMIMTEYLLSVDS